MNAESLRVAVLTELQRRADPAKAEPMRAYMRSEMPFLGAPAPDVRKICRTVQASSIQELWQLWDQAAYREERYVAIGLSGRFVVPEALPLFEHMIVTGEWWDLTDPVAIHRVGPLLPGIHDAVLDWSRDGCLWKRRAAILCQNARKQQTDVPLLHSCIEANVTDGDFFIRKAIGWALRERAKLAPHEVVAFAAGHELSPLSRREALKHLRGKS